MPQIINIINDNKNNNKKIKIIKSEFSCGRSPLAALPERHSCVHLSAAN